MTHLVLDPFSGIAGDMLVGALLDLGAPLARVRAGIDSLGLDGVSVHAEPVDRGPLRATWFRVDLGPEPERHPHRGLAEVTAIVASGDLPPAVRERALDTFRRLAVAEAAVHGKTPETVHFHEVGALDAICDVVGAALALDALGVSSASVGTLPLGSGTVSTAHGELPVPAPATIACLQGFDVVYGGPETELVTPTGAALVASLCDGSGHPQKMRVRGVGYGAGTRNPSDRANALRAVLADVPSADDRLVELATNVDHLAPTVLGAAVERLMDGGAVDVTVTPALMKKGRPGHVVTVLCPAERVDELEARLFAETGTLGVRRRAVVRTVLDRAWVEVATPYGAVRVKVGRHRGRITSAVPEFEECRSLADAAGVPVGRVIDAALASPDFEPPG